LCFEPLPYGTVLSAELLQFSTKDLVGYQAFSEGFQSKGKKSVALGELLYLSINLLTSLSPLPYFTTEIHLLIFFGGSGV
jgi:hypothetical protein